MVLPYVRQKVFQCPVESNNEGRVNAQWKMNPLQFGDAVFHSHAYRGVTRRNHHTDAYAQEGVIRYWQIQVFSWLSKMLIHL